MSTTFQDAAHLNNEGVTALLQGDHASAIDSMGKAIRLMKVEISQQVAARSASSTMSVSQHVETQSTSTVEIPSMESSDTIVFNQAIRIPANARNLSEFEINIYTSAVIFNLALAHQYNACGDATYMTKAEKLYSMVLKLLDDKDSLNVHTALIVKLACVNNLSQIRYSQGDFKHAQEGVHLVSSFMRNSSNKAMFENPEIQGLVMNVLLLKAPVVAKAA